jgi:site-specific DNA-methyltransferase (adenine-specific)
MLKKYINKIIQGDCLEVLREIPDNSVDMTFADPPFNLNKKYNNYDDTIEKIEYLNWCNDWISEMVRILKPSGTILVHNIPRWLTYFADHLNKIAYFRHWISWDSGGAPMGKTLLPNHYGILYYTKSKSYKDIKFNDIRYPHPKCRKCKEFIKDYGGKKDQAHGFGPLLSDVWTDIHRIRHKKRRDDHPCQLPIPLLERLILMTTDEGDIVLDPFLGTGTTAVAARQLGRRYIGIELDSDYIEIAQKNISAAIETKINGCYVSIYLKQIRTMRNKDFKEIWKINDDGLNLYGNIQKNKIFQGIGDVGLNKII